MNMSVLVFHQNVIFWIRNTFKRDVVPHDVISALDERHTAKINECNANNQI